MKKNILDTVQATRVHDRYKGIARKRESEPPDTEGSVKPLGDSLEPYRMHSCIE